MRPLSYHGNLVSVMTRSADAQPRVLSSGAIVVADRHAGFAPAAACDPHPRSPTMRNGLAERRGRQLAAVLVVAEPHGAARVSKPGYRGRELGAVRTWMTLPLASASAEREKDDRDEHELPARAP
jgi:hypothetical protein